MPLRDTNAPQIGMLTKIGRIQVPKCRHMTGVSVFILRAAVMLQRPDGTWLFALSFRVVYAHTHGD